MSVSLWKWYLQKGTTDRGGQDAEGGPGAVDKLKGEKKKSYNKSASSIALVNDTKNNSTGIID